MQPHGLPRTAHTGTERRGAVNRVGVTGSSRRDDDVAAMSDGDKRKMTPPWIRQWAASAFT